MIRSMIVFAGSLMVVALSAPAFAGKGEGHGRERQARGQGEGVQRRLENQRKRIEHGVKKGRLTEQQAAELKQNVDKIEAGKTEALKDGKISKEEREKLKGELKQSSEQIRNLKHPTVPGTPASPAPAAP